MPDQKPVGRDVQRGGQVGRPLVPRSASANWSARGGGVVIDSPDIRGIGLAGDEESIDAACAGIHEAGVHCRFRDCRHEDEPECAVTRAV